MMFLNTTLLKPACKGELSSAECNGSGHLKNATEFCNMTWYTLNIQILGTLGCVFGVVGNGKVIWLLGFCIKRNPFTTYVLNLAIADSCSLLLTFAYVIMLSVGVDSEFLNSLVDILFFFAYNASIYLLTAISVERCLSVLFPFWYRCHRPECCSATVSFLLWVLSGLFSGIMLLFTLLGSKESYSLVLNISCTVNFLAFTPFMIVSGLTLSIKFCHSSQEHHPARMHTAILITLLFFMIFGIPLSILYFFHFNSNYISFCDLVPGFLLATFNSSINPLIYYLVGREKKHRSRESLKVALQRLLTDSSEGNQETN